MLFGVPVETLVPGAAVLAVVVGLLLWRPWRRHPEPVAVRFTPHAVERMAQRRVSEAQVREVLAHPDRAVATTYESPDGGERDSVRLERGFRRRLLKVWVPADWRANGIVAVKSVAWQYSETLRIPGARAGRIIGRGGQTIRDLERAYDVRISVDGGMGLARIVGDDAGSVASARREIRRLVR
ncbi:KH domain-containing protein [Pseudolysinimonas sp.]|uniref:KH domain-containing protein n=1 Tax=Pseudolysinimonas sp. TaxID=2680009 RepID=UPI003783F71A